MAVDISKLVSDVKERISLDELRGKVIAIDAYNTIYQFLSIIRQPNGMPLTDSKNRVTSHLSGLFYRTISLLEYGAKPIFVFDGMPPALKRKTIEARIARRQLAMEEWKKAVKEGMTEEAHAYAMASTRITKEIVDDSKELLGYMGIPWMQATGEGEAEGAYMTQSGVAYASASQDYDSFLFGAEVVIRNLTISGKRKLPKKNVYVDISTERILLSRLLERYGISRRQLILIGMLIGTDFNEGIDGVGPMTALKIVKGNGSIEEITKYVESKYGKQLDVNPKEVLELFENPEIKEINKEECDALMNSAKPSESKMIRFMCDEHGFSPERIKKFTDKLIALKGSSSQMRIDKWIK